MKMQMMVLGIAVLAAAGCAAVLAWTLYKERAKTKRLLALLYTDPLTGEDSYQKFCKLAGDAVRNSSKKAAIISMDLDRFKLVNELFGQEKGDWVLCYMSRIWRRWIRDGEMFARSIADRFVALAFYENREELAERLDRFIYQLQNDNLEEMEGYVFRPSMGVYLVQDKQEKLQSMMNYAALAYAVAKKENGVYYEIYDEAFRRNMLESKMLEDEMEMAYKNQEFILYYQPKFDAKTKELKGAEALVRWQKPDGTLISPGIFIPAAEDSGFVVKLDRYIFSKACEQLRRWQEKELPLVPVSVNLSREHLRDASFVEEYREIRSRSGIPAKAIELEITESAMFENQKRFREIADELHDIGFRILMDDFGTGYSSLMMLKTIPVDVMKLDKSFVDDYNDSRGEKIINCVVSLAKAMRIQITAEGVETREQYEYLRDLDCDMIQGYYFAKPMSSEEFEKLLLEMKTAGTVRGQEA